MTLPHDSVVTLKFECAKCKGDGSLYVRTIDEFIPCNACEGQKYVTEEVELATFLGSQSLEIRALKSKNEDLTQEIDNLTQELNETKESLATAWKEIENFFNRDE